MNERRGPCPFVPGRGGIPPYLAGRGAEQRKLLDLFAYLEAGQGAPRDAVLSGPRGNGKTALLRWFSQEIEAQETRTDIVWLTPSEMSDLDQLATSLVPPVRFTVFRRHRAAGVGIGWPKPIAQVAPHGTVQTSPAGAASGRSPYAPPRDVGQALLNASQTVSGEAPFLMVMAGTPGLQPHLNTMSATFWSRAEKIGIGRLDADASAAALVRPMAEQEPPITFQDHALAYVVEDSPYFLQLWGAALWAAAQSTGNTRIDAGLVSAAAADFNAQRAAYYEDRREELERADLLAVAAKVARAFADRATLSSEELNTVLGEASAEDSTAAVLRFRDQLATTGFFWKPPDAGDTWQPGIPSLMEYVIGTRPEKPAVTKPS